MGILNKQQIEMRIKGIDEDGKEKYKKDDEVSGVVIKFNRHGALVSIQEGVAGLAHISEFKSEADMRQNLELGKSYKFKITLFEPENQRLTLKQLEQ